MTGLVSYTHALSRRLALAGRRGRELRRVYFSFHYQNDIGRVEQIRDAWRRREENLRQACGFYDGGLWDNAQRTGDDAIKSLILHSLKTTSVTCILAGAQTYLRRWVRYEIARSVARGNGLLTVKIHKLGDPAGQIADEAPDPLDYMAIYRAPSGRYLLAERIDGNWLHYEDYAAGFCLPSHWHQPDTVAFTPLSSFARCYCYVRDAGEANFADWIDAAN